LKILIAQFTNRLRDLAALADKAVHDYVGGGELVVSIQSMPAYPPVRSTRPPRRLTHTHREAAAWWRHSRTRLKWSALLGILAS
jgi:hypothetical protein